MTRGLFAVLGVVLALPSAGWAQVPTTLFSDKAGIVFGIEVQAITTSPLGKKVIGNDKPFDATRKLLKVLFPPDVFDTTDHALEPLEAVANRIERVTVVLNLEPKSGPTPIAVYLEGAIDEEEYFKAAEAVAKAEKREFAIRKLNEKGDRKLFVVGQGQFYGLRVSQSLFLVVTDRAVIDEVLEKQSGQKKAQIQPVLAGILKEVKPKETPIWLAVGEFLPDHGFAGGIATISFQDNAEFRLKATCTEEREARSIETLLGHVVDYLAESKRPYGKLWDAAKIVVKRDNLIVTATASIPGKLLAEEYAKQK
jgi:hypothetical protein